MAFCQTRIPKSTSGAGLALPSTSTFLSVMFQARGLNINTGEDQRDWPNSPVTNLLMFL